MKTIRSYEGLRLCHLGYQLGHSRKWMSCYQDSGLSVFIVNVDEYDELMDCRWESKLVGSLRWFSEIVNIPWLRDSGVVALLNNVDLFERKLKNTPMDDVFSECKDHEESDLESNLGFVSHLLMGEIPEDRHQYFNTIPVYNGVDDMIIKDLIDSHKHYTLPNYC